VACLWRGVGEAPTELRWRAPNGSEVLLLHLRDSYSNAARLPTDEDGFVQGLAELRDSLAPYATTSHVLAMQGTDHMRPRPDIPRLLAAADARLEDTHVVHSTLPRYLAAVRDELGEGVSHLPSIAGELRSPQRAQLLPGVLSTRMWIKQRNHACETLLERWAEPFVAIAGQVDEDTRKRVDGGFSARIHPSFNPSARQLIRRAWRYLLENHPHDSICGCSVDQVHREMAPRFDWCEQIGQEVTRRALETIAQQIELESPAIVVFNPSSAPRTGTVSIEMEPALESSQPLLDEAGQPVPYRTLGRRTRKFFSTMMDREGFALLAAQFESANGRIEERFTFRRAVVAIEGDTAHVDLFVSQQERATPGPVNQALEQAQAMLANGSIQRYIVRAQEERVNIEFVARDVPPLGYLTYTLRTGCTDSPPTGAIQPASRIEHPATSIENDYFHVQASSDDGTLTITDRTTGRVLQGCNRFVDGGDRGDEYNYCQPEYDRPVDCPATPPTIRLISADEVGATIEIATTYAVPVSLASGDRSRRSAETALLPTVTRVTLTPGVRRVDFETTVENHIRDHRLRVHFPTGLGVNTACADGHFAVVERPLDVPAETAGRAETAGWVEQPALTHPQRAFVDVSDGERGVMLANRGLPEYEVLRSEDGAEIALTLLRCVGWLSRDDMHCRLGNAGPEEAVSEAQCPGRHTFRYSLIPHAGDCGQTHALAYGFQTDLRAIVTDGRRNPATPGETRGLAARLSFITVSPSTLQVSAVKQPEDGEGLVVRCWNAGEKPVEGVIRLWKPFRRALRVNLAEEGTAELTHDGHAATLLVRGSEVATVRFEF
jgi:mannosylglycerate hydrolase